MRNHSKVMMSFLLLAFVIVGYSLHGTKKALAATSEKRKAISEPDRSDCQERATDDRGGQESLSLRYLRQ